MFSKHELLDAIKECEKNPTDYPDCMKLATFYTIYDHLYPNTEVEQIEETTIGDYGHTDFLAMVAGRNAEQTMQIIDELMSTLQAVQPRLYDAVMRKFGQLD